MKIDYLNDASRMTLTKLIPGIEMYFGDSIECYEGLYKKIDEYLSDVERDIEYILDTTLVQYKTINNISEKIAIIRKSMYMDQQNEMTTQIYELNAMLWKMRCY